MLFNSLQFFIFFIIVYCLYLSLSHRNQNRMLLLASYIFYGAWDWRFLSLLWISTIVDYICGHKIYASNNPKLKKQLLFVSIATNLTILGFFKYFNFFADTLATSCDLWGIHLSVPTLKIILPVGISFYTFQTMSYTFDIYYNKMKPKKGFLDFALFVAFFPQLVAGPIERAKNLLPQIHLPRKVTLDNFYQGCYLIFWGLFMKVFIADNLATIVNPIFASSGPSNAADILLGIYAFTFQIFCDFAGYSNIARGLCKCMGFEIMVNFNLPYFARNPKEFWQRWHISLSTWLRDYLYIPLGGNKRGGWITYRNLGITMLLGGLWHGASWTFIAWGAYHGVLLIAHRATILISKGFPQPKTKVSTNIISAIKVFFFFHLTCFGWMIFRAESFQQIIKMSSTLLTTGHQISLTQFAGLLKQLGPYLIVLLAVQILQYYKNDLMAVYKLNVAIKIIFYFICTLLLIIWGITNAQDFIYFQF